LASEPQPSLWDFLPPVCIAFSLLYFYHLVGFCASSPCFLFGSLL
jgi:hypothetical protein